MLDYPFFLGLAAYFALSVSQNPKVGSFRFDCLRWTVALTLMWPSMENFLYPAWIASILRAHPHLTLGFDVATVITAAGVVEFGLSFALFWTPLVRRLAAAVLALLLLATTFDFGKMDGIGHVMIITILLLVFADPGRKHAGCRPAVAPLVGGTALLAFIFLYSSIHTLYYGSSDAALVPLMGGAALLTVGFLCVRRVAVPRNNPVPVAIVADRNDPRIGRDEGDDDLTVPRWLITQPRLMSAERSVALLENSDLNTQSGPSDDAGESPHGATILGFPR
jgi:hypothetical protein